MDRDWRKEWAAFQDNCLNELRGSSRQTGAIAHLWYFPSFESCMSWAIRPNYKAPETFILKRATWNQMVDLEKFGLHSPLEELKARLDRSKGIVPKPSVTVMEVTVPAEELNAILAQGYNIRIPLLLPRDGIFGCDGSSHGFASGTYAGNSSIEWWEEGPDEWQPFIVWWKQLQELVDGNFVST